MPPIDSANKNSSSTSLSQLVDRFELATMCSRHGNHSRFQVSTPNYQESDVTRAWKDRGINLTKKMNLKNSIYICLKWWFIYNLKILGFEAIRQRPAYSSQLGNTLLCFRVSSHGFSFGNFAVKTKLDNEYKFRCTSCRERDKSLD